jgi:hypothetical protein
MSDKTGAVNRGRLGEGPDGAPARAIRRRSLVQTLEGSTRIGACKIRKVRRTTGDER